MNNTYYINIEPISYYFFGGERTFKTKEHSKHEVEGSNYYAISNEYPQQTAILGLLRYMCLTIADDLSNKDQIIGDNFSISHVRENKGWLRSISPLVISKKRNENDFQFLYPKPYNVQGKDQISVNIDLNNKCRFHNINKYSPSLSSEFDYKSFDTSVKWADEANEVHAVFAQPLIKSGVNIATNKENKEDGYFMQKFYKLERGYSFGVWVNFSENAQNIADVPIIMPFGADQGLFKITFHKQISNIFEKVNHLDKGILYLISDAYVTNKVYDYIDFGFTEEVDFRFINSKKSNYYAINNTKDKSDKYQLLKRGSVLYCKDIVKVIEHLKNPIFTEIGYNHYNTI